MTIGIYHGTLKEVREAQGLSVEALAERVGIEASTIQRYESGGGRPKPHHAFKLKEELDVAWDSLFYFAGRR